MRTQRTEVKRANQEKGRPRKKAFPLPTPFHIENGGAVLDAMSNAMRLVALDALSREEQSVGQVALILGLSQSATSQHLRILKKAGLLTSRRRSQSVFYACRSKAALALLQVVLELFPLAEVPEPSAEAEAGHFPGMDVMGAAS
jgi:DNA-binding transcriptional ArsR family regulator